VCLSVSAAANQITPSNAPVTADKLGHRLDSDDESLAEYMGQLSDPHTGVTGRANQVSSVLSSKMKVHFIL